MPRNDQVVRQYHLLRWLERPGGASLSELTASLPPDFARHARTVRRDLLALQVAGYPIVTERSDGQTRWRLMDGFRGLPAPGFTPTELMALALGGELLKPLDGTHIHAALASALAKVSAALPSSNATFLQQMRGAQSAGLGHHKTYGRHPETVRVLNEAIETRCTVRMRYYTAWRRRINVREVDPYHLRYAGGALYLIAFDHRRREILQFAVERIRSLVATERPYQLPLDFDVQAYLRDSLLVMRGRPILVELVLDKATAAWARDRVWHSSQRLTPLRDGRLRMTLRVADTRELVGWILGFGSGVDVVGPTGLRDRVRDEAARLVERLSDRASSSESPRKPVAKAGVARSGSRSRWAQATPGTAQLTATTGTRQMAR